MPSWRHDIKDEIDIVEEIIRLNGYDNIENIELPYNYKNKPILNISEIRQRLIRNSLIKRGLYEAVTFSFLSKNDIQFFTEDEVFLELDNPISEELSIMRNTLLPNLINNFLNNVNKGLKNIGLFEVGAIYLGDSFDDQYNSAAGIRSGLAGKKHWSENARNVDLYDAKKDIYSALASLGININNILINRKTPKWYHPGRSGSINLGKSVLGYFGELHPRITKQYGIQMIAFEMFPDNLPTSFKMKNNKQFEKYNLMPIKRDFSFFINTGTTSLEIQDTIKATLKNNHLVELMEINIFDLYNNPSKEGITSIAFEIIMQPKEKTLNDNQIKNLSDTIVENIKEKNNAILKD